jgi:hypothetical protein
MRTWIIVSIVATLAASVAAFAQMTEEEAQQRLKERQAAEAAAAANPTPDQQEILELKSAIHSMREKLDADEKQIQEYRRLVPQVPQVGWGVERIRNSAFAHLAATDLVFDVTDDGHLQDGRRGQRVEITKQVGGEIALPLAGGGSVSHVAYIHNILPQVALYNVFVNNNTPYDPSLDPNDNIKRMTNVYVVLADVDNGTIESVARHDDIWNDILQKQEKEEDTLIMQQTTLIIHHSSGN